MIKVYDTNMQLQAILENAYSEGYNKKINEVWNAEFSLPADDPKLVECQPLRFVELFEADGERIELFRILPFKYSKSINGKTVTFVCEHVLSTLLDDILFQYHQNTNLTPAANISYLLSKQSTTRWQLGTVEFTDIFEYSWENKNILGSLFSIPKAFSGEYQWTFDTRVYPWKLNLIRPSSEPTARIMYRKNLISIVKEEDPTFIVTRLYPLGYGEGVNQLTIESVNGGVPYIDSDTISTYGVISTTYINKSQENAATLKAEAQAYLQTVKNPKVTYTVDAADLYSITGEQLDRIREPGVIVQVVDEDLGIFNSRIVSVSKSDISGAPGNVTVEISNKALTITDVNVEMQQKQYITDSTAQGATNIDSNDYQDNCDSTHPAVIKFYIPNECVRINKCLLSYETGKFRAYDKATGGGGALTQSSGNSQFDYDLVSGTPIWYGSLEAGVRAYTESQSDHNHGIPNGTALQIDPTGSVVFTASGGHYHNVKLYQHYHPLVESGLQHTHNISLPPHIHNIEYGIYENTTLPESLIIKVDGVTIPQSALSGNNVDIVDYLSTDSNGKIKRGQFHTVEITPNSLARITATVIKQLFLQSRGGGDY